jgi:REP element-mobilizing transposase RayT
LSQRKTKVSQNASEPTIKGGPKGRKPTAAQRPRCNPSPKVSKSGQLKLLADEPKAYGGDLLKTRKGRQGGRPLDTRNTMHMVLRSTKAKGEWSFSRTKNSAAIQKICGRFATKYGVKIVSMAYVGNHLHFQLKLGNRHTYRPFVRAITGAIAMAVTGACRWNPLAEVLKGRSVGTPSHRNTQSSRGTQDSGVRIDDHQGNLAVCRFWDRRPFTRTVSGLRGFLTLNDYIRVNQYEGFGYERRHARFLTEWRRAGRVNANRGGRVADPPT